MTPEECQAAAGWVRHYRFDLGASSSDWICRAPSEWLTAGGRHNPRALGPGEIAEMLRLHPEYAVYG